MIRIVLPFVLVGSAFFVPNNPIGFRPESQVHAAEENDNDDEKPHIASNRPTTFEEARGRAKLLHETIHGALQVMHRDLFREDEKLTIPSQSLEDVFRELARSHGVQVRWLAVNTEAMNVDHKPETDFEKKAIKALSAGQQDYESTEGDIYRHAGVIRLSSQCLKCHVPNRTSTKDRAAGLVIIIPLLDPMEESR